jgi:hypothetical protein
MDVLFNLIRVGKGSACSASYGAGLFYFDKDMISRNLDKAETLLAEGGDWDRCVC